MIPPLNYLLLRMSPRSARIFLYKQGQRSTHSIQSCPLNRNSFPHYTSSTSNHVPEATSFSGIFHVLGFTFTTIGSDSDTEPSPPPSPEGFPGGYSPYQSDDDLQDDHHLRQPPAQDIWVLSEFFTEHRSDLGFILLTPSPPSWEVGVVGALAHAIRSATDPSHHDRFHAGFSYFVRTLYAFFSVNIQQVGPMVCYPYPGWALGVIRALSHVHRLSWDPRKVVDLERRLSLDLLYPEQF